MRNPSIRLPLVLSTAAALLSLAAPTAFATTIAGGNIINQTWTPAGSPYLIQGDIAVPAGSSLVIQAGTTVQFAPSDGQAAGLNANFVEFTIKGTLTISGTVNSPVSLTGQNNSPGTWYGIVVDAAATSVKIDNANVQYALNGIQSAAAGSVLQVTGSTIGNNGSAAIYLTAGSPTISGSSMASSGYGLMLSGSASPTVSNSIFYANSLAVYQGATSGTTNLVNCTIDGSRSEGIHIVGSGNETTIIRNCIVTNSHYGVNQLDSSKVTVTNTDVWGNTSADYLGGPVPGAGCIFINPLYANAAGGNFRLTSNSPCRFAGDTMGDIGGAPYVNDATAGLYGTLWTDTHLTVAGSPYSVPGDLTVPLGHTLTIDPGVTLSFAANDIMAANLDARRGELIVAGTLTAVGTSARPIVIAGQNAGLGVWYGVEFLNTANNVTLSYAQISNAHDGVVYSSTGVKNALSQLTISSCDDAGVNALTSVALDAIAVSSCVYGVVSSGTAGITLTNGVLYGNTHGLFLGSTSGVHTIVNCTINNNTEVGVYLGGSAETTNITNSIITNSAYGISRADHSTVTVTYSDVWGNTRSNYDGGAAAGVGCISADPLFKAAPGDLHLTMGSFCIDAGVAMGAPNHDRDEVTRPLDGDGINGAQFDIGAYEFTFTQVCGNGLVEPGEACDDALLNGTYGHCNNTCSGFGARCGDGAINGAETCDDGANNGKYGFCNATCTGPGARCGDGTVNGPEACDDAGNNGKYGYCNNTCSAPGPRCGDGTINGPEVCDDGANNGKAGFCNANCTAGGAGRCGDGVVVAPEACDDGALNGTYGHCNALCSGMGARCGDGSVNGPEQCDDGGKNGQYGFCNAMCTGPGPRCGDGVINGNEMCDDGGKNGQYGYCNAFCNGVGAHCGDGIVQPPESCDDGGHNGQVGFCNGMCTGTVAPTADLLVIDMSVLPDLTTIALPDMTAPLLPDMTTVGLPDMANAPLPDMTTAGAVDMSMRQSADMGPSLDDGFVSRPDQTQSGGGGEDAAGAAKPVTGCGCRVGDAKSTASGPTLVLALLATGLVLRRRRPAAQVR